MHKITFFFFQTSIQTKTPVITFIDTTIKYNQKRNRWRKLCIQFEKGAGRRRHDFIPASSTFFV